MMQFTKIKIPDGKLRPLYGQFAMKISEFNLTDGTLYFNKIYKNTPIASYRSTRIHKNKIISIY